MRWLSNMLLYPHLNQRAETSKIIARYATGRRNRFKGSGRKGNLMSPTRLLYGRGILPCPGPAFELSQKTAHHSRWIKEGQWNYRAPCAGLKEKVVGLIATERSLEGSKAENSSLCVINMGWQHAMAEELKKHDLFWKQRSNCCHAFISMRLYQRELPCSQKTFEKWRRKRV